VIRVKTNISVVSSSLLNKIAVLKNPQQFLRPVAIDALALMTERIHEEGKAADGSPIGTYSNNYLKLRQGKYKRNGDTKITVSLTRQLENTWSVIATTNGWGIGFTNVTNAQKLKWVEEQKSKKIGALTTKEKEYAITKLEKVIKEALSK
jgi:hypothetical protein